MSVLLQTSIQLNICRAATRLWPSIAGHGGSRELVGRFENVDICRLTEQVIFTDPYYSAPVNRHTSPQLDDLAHAFQHDVQAKAAVTALKVRRHDCLETHSQFHQPS